MPVQVVMPDLLDASTDARVVKWLKAEGDAVIEDEAICEVQSNNDKQLVCSPMDGQLLKILTSEGERTLAGAILAWVGDSAEDWWEETQSINAKAEADRSAGRYRGFISPAVARLLQKYPVDLSGVHGSGEDGRVTRSDLLAFLVRKGYLSSEEDVEIDGQSLPPDDLSAPIHSNLIQDMPLGVQLFNAFLLMEADLSAVAKHRELSQQVGLKFTFSAYFIKAVVEALKSDPGINVTWSPEGILRNADAAIGFLIYQNKEQPATPTFKGLENLSLAGIAHLLEAITNKAHTQSLRESAPQPGTITIINHGAGGSLVSYPGIQFQQSPLLNIGAIKQHPILVDGERFEWHPVVSLTLTYDCRVISIYQADRFLRKIVSVLEQWDLST